MKVLVITLVVNLFIFSNQFEDYKEFNLAENFYLKHYTDNYEYASELIQLKPLTESKYLFETFKANNFEIEKIKVPLSGFINNSYYTFKLHTNDFLGIDFNWVLICEKDINESNLSEIYFHLINGDKINRISVKGNEFLLANKDFCLGNENLIIILINKSITKRINTTINRNLNFTVGIEIVKSRYNTSNRVLNILTDKNFLSGTSLCFIIIAIMLILSFDDTEDFSDIIKNKINSSINDHKHSHQSKNKL